MIDGLTISFEIETPRSPEEVAAAMEKLVEPLKLYRCPFRSFPGEAIFEGKVSAERFETRRIFYYREPLPPNIVGEIEATDGGARIRVRIDPDPFGSMLVVGVSVLFGGVAAVGLAVGWPSIVDMLFTLPLLGIAVAMPVFSRWRYLREAVEERDILKSFLDGLAKSSTG